MGPESNSEGEDWKRIPRAKRVATPTLLQMEAVECGAAALGIILRHFEKWVPLEDLRVKCGVSRDGSSARSIVRAGRAYGLQAKGFKYGLEKLVGLKMPVIIHWNFNHFVVLEGFQGRKVYINNPASGPEVVSDDELEASFTGIALTFEPGPDFERGGRKPSTFRALRSRLTNLKTPLIFAALCGLLLLVPSLATPAFNSILLDDVLVGGHVSWLIPLLWCMGAAAATTILLTWLQQSVLLRMETRLSLSSSAKFFLHVLRLPIEFFAQRFGGEIGSRVLINDRVARVVSEHLVVLVISLFSAAVFGLFMFAYDWVLATSAVSMALVNLLIMRFTARKRVDASRRLLRDQGKILATSMSGLQVIEALKASGSESEFFARWAGHQAKALRAKQTLGLYAELTMAAPLLVSSLTGVAILVVGGWRIMDGLLTIGTLVAFQTLFGFFTRPMSSVVNFGNTMQELRGDLDRLDDVLGYEEDIMFRRTYDREIAGSEVTKLSGRLDLVDVTFGYNPLDPPLIENLNLTIKPGQRLALVGASGSGKSTVAKLVAGLYRPQAGQILFDGIPRDEIPPDFLNSSVAVVDQDIFLFGGSVRENLTMWDSTISDREVMEALQDADVLDVVALRPGGDQSLVAEAGANYSGGQRQRLEIARALVGRPSLLVLDEATSALDATTEKHIDAHLRRRGCACLIVAHRLSTIRDCDEIVVMEAGKVVQRGTHDELIALEGVYQRLIKE
jgi:NHLM bacteriocin system ABC transporter peptidase/ATP-binding protein